MTTTRRLAAILAADVAGYSRLMGADEVGTLDALKSVRREIGDPAIAAHNGRIVKTTGDGTLVEFASAVDAVTCAVAFQEKVAERNKAVHGLRLEYRIGINIGDIISEGDDIYGDGVNVAARIENECEPGGVYLSEDAFRQVRGKTSITFDDLGERALKNIERPVRVYAVRSGTAPGEPGRAEVSKPLPLPDKPSIAVLPFQNISGDPEQEYFADGMVEDIITALSRFKSLFVIARNSSFTYRGNAIDIKQVGRELGVRYVLEGSVRKAGGRIRITGQLIEAETNNHLWADKFDGPLDDIFELQDRVTAEVVGAIAPSIERAEYDRAKRRLSGNASSYDLYVKGRELVAKGGRESIEEALAIFVRVLERDAERVEAYASAAYCYVPRKTNGWMLDEISETAEARRLADIAIRLGQDDAFCLAQCVLVYSFVLRQAEFADKLVEKALLLNPNYAFAWNMRSHVHVHLGRHEAAIEAVNRCERLSPRDRASFRVRGIKAWALMFLRRFDEACSLASEVLGIAPEWTLMHATLAASHALAGRATEARHFMEIYRRYHPHLCLSAFPTYIPNTVPSDIALWVDGMRLAGMPE